MPEDPHDSTYDLAVPPPAPVEEQQPAPEPLVLEYHYREPPPPPPPPMTPTNKLSLEEKLWFWLRAVGSVCLILMGAAWVYFVPPIDWVMVWGIGGLLIGGGIALFMFAGPTDAEKRGYHF